MRQLTEDELFSLQSLVEDNVRYLVIEAKEGLQRLYRMTFPNYEQRQKAALEKHRYRSALGNEKGLLTRRQLEKIHKDEIAEINTEIGAFRDDLERQKREFMENDVPALPDAEDDPESIRPIVEKRAAGIQKTMDRLTELGAAVDELLSNSIEELVTQHHMAVLSQQCWQQATDDNWEPVWSTWDEFKADTRPISRMLVNETRLWFMGGVPFFASLRYAPTGGSVF